MEGMELPARLFAAAWLNVWCATGQDEDRPALYRTVMVDDLGEGRVRLWATDSYALFRAGVTTDPHEDGVGDDEAEQATYVVMDPDARAKALMKYVWKDATEKRKPDATLTIAAAKSAPVGLTLDLPPRDALAITYEGERLILDRYEGTAPSWRSAVEGHTPKTVKRIGLGHEAAIKPLAGIRSADGIVPPIEFTWGGDKGLADVLVRCRPYLRASIAPVQLEA